MKTTESNSSYSYSYSHSHRHTPTLTAILTLILTLTFGPQKKILRSTVGDDALFAVHITLGFESHVSTFILSWKSEVSVFVECNRLLGETRDGGAS